MPHALTNVAADAARAASAATRAPARDAGRTGPRGLVPAARPVSNRQVLERLANGREGTARRRQHRNSAVMPPPAPVEAAQEREAEAAADRAPVGVPVVRGARIHTDSAADRAARALGADAFTIGDDIGFRAGKYAPRTAAGRSLLAHEMTHVLQQRRAPAGRAPVLQCARAVPFDPDAIAAQLDDAMRGWGTNETAIYGALSGRTREQIDGITNAYRARTGRSLQADLEDELTTGELRHLGVYAPAAEDDPAARAEMVAVQLRDAIEGWGTDEEAIYAALNGRTPDELNAIKAAYVRLTGRALLDDLRDDLSGDELQRALGQMDVPPEVYEHNTELGMLSVGNFDFHFRDCKVLVWVWVRYQFTDDINATERADFKRRFEAAVHAMWAHTGYTLSGSGPCPCPSVPIEIHVAENPGGFYHKLVDVEKRSDSDRRPNIMRDINVNLGTSDDTLGHEFGHVLGLYDEYDGGFFENIMFWHRNRLDDPDALMNTGAELRPRYFEHYRARVQRTAPTGCAYRVSSPLPPAPGPGAGP